MTHFLIRNPDRNHLCSVAMRLLLGLVGLCSSAAAQHTPAPAVRITLDGSAPRVNISPDLYGIFLEEINHAGEGGIYAELVQNRDFEANTLPAGAQWAGNLIKTRDGWQERKGNGNELWGWRLEEHGSAVAQIRQVVEQPLNPENPHSMRLAVTSPGAGVAVVNDGFWGMNFVAGQDYDLSFYARTEPGARIPLQASLESASGREPYATQALTLSGDWKRYHLTLRSTGSDPRGRLSLAVSVPCKLWLDVVSLFPRKTYKDRPNGLRPDLVGVLDQLHPAFMRFPGGAVTGGLNLDDRFQWKHSIGDIARRRGMFDLWGYYSTNGLGFHEYLQLIEDLGGTALYVCNPGFSDNYRHAEYASPDRLPDFIQEALDAIEYALGPVDTQWGSERARNGHPAPFPLRYVEIGNETSGMIYPEKYRQFYRAIKAKYPQLTVIAADQVANAPVDMIDRHEFGASAKLYDDWTLFDTMPRSGPAYYVGEFSVDRGSGEGDLESALAEAAFRLGLERNSDLVRMSSYAPLLANVQDNAWPVNMIHFDNSRVAPRTSYYVQQMFVANRPDQTLKTTIDPAPTSPAGPVYALGGWDRTHREIVLKIVNRSSAPQSVAIGLHSLPSLAGPVAVTTLSSDDPTAENTVDDPALVVPSKSTEMVASGPMHRTLPANSLTVLRFATVPGS